MSTTRINRFVAKTGKASELKTLLTEIIAYISASAGCDCCELLQQNNEPNEFVILEKWRSKADHQASVAGFPKNQMTSAMQLLAEVPQGRDYELC